MNGTDFRCIQLQKNQLSDKQQIKFKQKVYEK